LRPHCIDACSSDLTTDVYESWSDVYLPTRQIETVSNRRSYLRGAREEGQPAAPR